MATQAPPAGVARGAILRNRIQRELVENPSFVPALVCVAILVWFGADEGGFIGTTWMPAALIALGLLGVSLFAMPPPRAPRPIVVAVVLLAAYAAWSYLSILWAHEQGLAWDGANRTVLYAVLFALFALWPMRSREAAVLLGLYGLGIAVVAGVELVRATHAAQWIDYFHEGRLQGPVGYVNANVALWFSAFWPCVILAGRVQVPASLRALFLGAAGVLGSAAILGQSRGWLFVLPVALVLAVAIVPGRGRTVVALLLVTGAMLVILRPLLDVYEAFRPTGPPGHAFSAAVRDTFIVSGVLAILSYAWALGDGVVLPSARAARRISAALVVVFALVCAGGVGAYAVVKGNPVSHLGDAWREFKKGGYEPSGKATRFGTTFATYRYDYWSVAWGNFKRHPVAGVGADNYGQYYLRRGKSIQTPKYPHSTVLVFLSETGLIGGILALGALAAALIAALPSLRRPDLAGAVGGAGLMIFAYWILHGSLDWLWEFPGLAGPALAGLGLAAAVSRGRQEIHYPGRPFLSGRLRVGTAAALGCVVAIALAVPWMAERQLRKGRELASRDPAAALSHLDRSSDLDPLSPLADQTAGLVEMRRGRYTDAERRFRKALDRDPGDPYSVLQLGAIASVRGDEKRALRLVSRAHALDPRDAVIQTSLSTVRRGETLYPEHINAQFVHDIDVRIGPR